MFFDGFTPSLHFCIDTKLRILDGVRPCSKDLDHLVPWDKKVFKPNGRPAAPPSREDVKWHHISAELPNLACQQIARMVRVTEPEPVKADHEEQRDSLVEKWARTFSQDGDLFCGADVFPNLRYVYRMNLGGNSRSDSRRKFMYNMTKLDVKLPYRIESFVRVTAADGGKSFMLREDVLGRRQVRAAVRAAVVKKRAAVLRKTAASKERPTNGLYSLRPRRGSAQ